MKRVFKLSKIGFQNVPESRQSIYSLNFDTEGYYYSLFISFSNIRDRNGHETFITIRHYQCKGAHGLVSLPNMINSALTLKHRIDDKEFTIKFGPLIKNILVNEDKTLIMFKFNESSANKYPIQDFIDSIFSKERLYTCEIEVEVSDDIIANKYNGYSYLSPEEYDAFLAWYLNKGPGKPELFNHIKNIKQTLFPVLREVTKENGIMVEGRNYYEDYI